MILGLWPEAVYNWLSLFGHSNILTTGPGQYNHVRCHGSERAG